MASVIHLVNGDTVNVAGTPQEVTDFLVKGKADDDETWAHMEQDHGMGPVAIKVSAVTHIVAVPE